VTYPILEHDPTREALIEPSQLIEARDMPGPCVLCFFLDVIEQVVAEHEAAVVAEHRWEDGPHCIYEIAHRGQRLAFLHPGVGGPVSAGLLEAAIACGCRAFVACGGCGVLEKDVAVGQLIVVSAAVRDEGTSYHYLPPAREVEADPRGVEALAALLAERGVPHRVGKTWTTSAPYRETLPKIEKRREEGCLTVEMEAAALMAVAQYRSVPFGQVLYAGDDLSGEAWDNRAWQTRADVREQLFWLAADAVLGL
jgi:uridine phosphorylase